MAQADLIEEQIGQIIKLLLDEIESNYTEIEYLLGRIEIEDELCQSHYDDSFVAQADLIEEQVG